MQRLTNALLILILFACLGSLISLPATPPVAAQQDPTTTPGPGNGSRSIYLPLVTKLAGSGSDGDPGGGSLAPSGEPLPIAYLGEKIPVQQKGGAFFTDQLNNTTGELALWIPPNANPIRGIFVDLNTSIKPNPADPDWRNEVAQNRAQAARQLASMWGFAHISGSVWADNRRDYAGQEKLLLDAIEGWAQASGRAELRNAPLLLSGGSRHAGLPFGFAQRHPKRTIAYVTIVMNSLGVVPGVPGIVVYGERDDQTARLSSFMRDRGQGALLSIAVIWGEGHICDRCGDLVWPWMDQVVRMRLPPDADPRKGPVTLKPVVETEGWLGDVDNWGQVYAYDQYPGDKRRAAWLPNRYTANLWRNFVIKQQTAGLTWPTQPYSWSNGFTQEPAPLFGCKLRDLSASKPVDIVATLNQPVNGEVRVYAGDVALGVGTVSADGKKVELKGVTLPPGLHGIILMQGTQPLSWPAGLILLR